MTVSNNHEEGENYWEYAGRYFGYPECCVKAFVNLEHLGAGLPNPLAGTGFVPCAECCHKSPAALTEAIESRRTCSAPFPDGGYEDQERDRAEWLAAKAAEEAAERERQDEQQA